MFVRTGKKMERPQKSVSKETLVYQRFLNVSAIIVILMAVGAVVAFLQLPVTEGTLWLVICSCILLALILKIVRDERQ